MLGLLGDSIMSSNPPNPSNPPRKREARPAPKFVPRYNSPDWTFLAGGQYNYVFVNPDRTRVLKVQQPDTGLNEIDLLLDTAERSVRLWNEINFGVAGKAMLVGHTGLHSPKGTTINEGVGWSSPFMSGRHSNQAEICDALVNIFNRSGRVVLDAMVRGNFITVDSPSGPQVVCVDIGMSLRLQEGMGARAPSFPSKQVWEKSSQSSYLPWFKKYENDKAYKDTVLMTKALFTLQQKFPFITNADFLKKSENIDIRDALAHELDNLGPMKISPLILTRLQSIQEEQIAKADPSMGVDAAIETTGVSGKSTSSIRGSEHDTVAASVDPRPPEQETTFKITFDAKHAYLKKLDQYIISRGSVDQVGHFSPSLSTKIFRNGLRTSQKVAFAFELKKKIENADTLDELKVIIKESMPSARSSAKGSLLDEGRILKSDLKRTLKSLNDILDISSASVPLTMSSR